MSTRKPYPSDVTDDEWAFVAPYLTLMTENAPQREYPLRETFNGLRWMARTGAPWRLIANDYKGIPRRHCDTPGRGGRGDKPCRGDRKFFCVDIPRQHRAEHWGSKSRAASTPRTSRLCLATGPLRQGDGGQAARPKIRPLPSLPYGLSFATGASSGETPCASGNAPRSDEVHDPIDRQGKLQLHRKTSHRLRI